ncbi:hypothetical protein C8J57DRAFT_1251394 [Mycena rebaudengoi]|nr:hypothetical protein C8J57DRAFT_1251394 [Mycena rebaudengoi]
MNPRIEFNALTTVNRLHRIAAVPGASVHKKGKKKAPKVITGPSPGIKVIASDKIHHVQGTTFPNSAATTLSDINTSAAPFLPSDVNIVVNTTVTQREFSWVGMLYFLPRIPEGATILDGSAKTITLFQTPPNGAEEFFLSVQTGPPVRDFCGMENGFFYCGILDTSTLDLGTYTVRMVVEYGESTQPDAPVDPNGGLWPIAFHQQHCRVYKDLGARCSSIVLIVEAQIWIMFSLIFCQMAWSLLKLMMAPITQKLKSPPFVPILDKYFDYAQGHREQRGRTPLIFSSESPSRKKIDRKPHKKGSMRVQ